MAHTAPAHDLGARIILNPLQSTAYWIGNRAQLEAEGFIPADVEWPQGKKPTRFDVGSNLFSINIYTSARLQALSAEMVYKIYHYHRGPADCRKRKVAVHLAEINKVLNVGSPAWRAAWELHYKARCDDAFQAFKRELLGQKKRGRKPNASKVIVGAQHA